MGLQEPLALLDLMEQRAQLEFKVSKAALELPELKA
jgi:hypothetical protein